MLTQANWGQQNFLKLNYLDAECLPQKQILTTPEHNVTFGHVHWSGDLELVNQEFVFLKTNLLKFRGLPHKDLVYDINV